MNRRIAAVLASLCFVLASAPSHAQSGDVIVEKKTFELPTYTTVAGDTIKPGTAPAEVGKDPAKALANKLKIEAVLEQTAAARAAVADANHFLYLCRANQLAAVDPANIKVPALILYAPNDLVFQEPVVQEAIQRIAAAGTSVESATLVGPNGHINAFTQITERAGQITAFLAK